MAPCKNIPLLSSTPVSPRFTAFQVLQALFAVDSGQQLLVTSDFPLLVQMFILVPGLSIIRLKIQIH